MQGGSVLQVGNKYTAFLPEVLGKGQITIVYRGEEIDTGRKIAVKHCKKENLLNFDGPKFEKWVLSHNTLSSEHILRPFDFLATKNSYYIISDYCSQNLRTFLEEENPRLSLDEGCKIFSQVIAGYQALNTQKRIHGRIKPSNILRRGLTWKLSDFEYSLTSHVEGEKLHPDEKLKRFIAPEVSAQSPPTIASDVWSLGLVLFYIIFKCLPRIQQPAGWTMVEFPPSPPLPFKLKSYIEDAMQNNQHTRPSIEVMFKFDDLVKDLPLPSQNAKPEENTNKVQQPDRENLQNRSFYDERRAPNVDIVPPPQDIQQNRTRYQPPVNVQPTIQNSGGDFNTRLAAHSKYIKEVFALSDHILTQLTANRMKETELNFLSSLGIILAVESEFKEIENQHQGSEALLSNPYYKEVRHNLQTVNSEIKNAQADGIPPIKGNFLSEKRSNICERLKDIRRKLFQKIDEGDNENSIEFYKAIAYLKKISMKIENPF